MFAGKMFGWDFSLSLSFFLFCFFFTRSKQNALHAKTLKDRVVFWVRLFVCLFVFNRSRLMHCQIL